MTVNSFHGTGRLTRDAEYSQTKSGMAMSKFRLAINSYRKQEEETTFVNVLCFGKMAENLNDRLTKGRIVAVHGPLKIEEYEDSENNRRTSVSIFANDISLGPDPNRAE